MITWERVKCFCRDRGEARQRHPGSDTGSEVQGADRG